MSQVALCLAAWQHPPTGHAQGSTATLLRPPGPSLTPSPTHPPARAPTHPRSAQILLRKGGIREPVFVPAPCFFLFPTAFHTEAELLKPSARVKYAREVGFGPRAQPWLALPYWAEVTGAWTTHDPGGGCQLSRRCLTGTHIVLYGAAWYYGTGGRLAGALCRRSRRLQGLAGPCHITRVIKGLLLAPPPVRSWLQRLGVACDGTRPRQGKAPLLRSHSPAPHPPRPRLRGRCWTS